MKRRRVSTGNERALGMVYNDNVSTFEKLLEKDNSITIHFRNLRILAKEPYKTNENLAAPIMHEIFEKRNIQYNLRSQTDFQLVSVRTVNCGLTLRPRMPHICGFLDYFSFSHFRLLAVVFRTSD